MTWSRVPLALAGLVLPLAANAQVMFDTTRVTCADYLAMSSTDAPLFSAFISGWFNQKTGHVTVDLNEYARNVANVRSWCATNPGETVFAGPARNRHKRPMIPQGELDYEP
jgi:hypothetical protein